jgi:hypothetical protein
MSPGLLTRYPDCEFPWYFRVFQGECWSSTLRWIVTISLQALNSRL